MVGSRYWHLEKRFIDTPSGIDDDSNIDEYRRALIDKSRSIADTIIIAGDVGHGKLEESLEYCLRGFPVSDFHKLDSVLYKGNFFAELRKERANSDAIIKALAMMHDTEITILGKGLLWKDYVKKKSAEVQKVKDERKSKRKKEYAKGKATLLRSWRFCGWQALISVGLLVAILFNEELEYGYFNILRFAVCAAFAYWAWLTHNFNKQAWRNAFVLTALFYNPFLPVKLGDAGSWIFVNLVTLGLVIASVRATGSKLNNEEGDA